MSLTVAMLAARLTADTSGFYKGMAVASSSMMTSGALIGRVAAGAGIAVGAMGALSLKAAGDFEQSMNILGAVSGATKGQMKGLQQQALDLGRDMKLPNVSARDAAEAMTELAKSGMSVKDVQGAVRGTLQLGIAANVGYSESAIIVARSLKAFGLEGNQAARVADLFTAASNKSTASITDVALGFQMASAQFKAGDQTISGLTTSLALMANAGIAGSDAGTSLKTMMNRLMAPTKKSADLMADLGFKVYDSSGNMKPMPQLISSLESSLVGMSKEQKNAALYTIFGSDAIRASRVMLDAGADGWNKMHKEVTKGGEAQAYAEAKTKGFNGAMGALGSVIQTLAIEMGMSLLPAATSVARALANLINNIDPAAIVGFFGAIKDGIVWVVKLVANSDILQFALASLLGAFTALFAVSKLIAVFKRVQGAWMALNASFAMSPLGLVVIAVGLLVGALVLAYMKVEWFRDAVNSAFSFIASFVPGAIETVRSVVSSVFGWLQEFIPKAINAVKDAVSKALGFMTANFGGEFAAIKNIAETYWGYIKGTIENTLNIIKGIINIVLGLIQGDWTRVWNGIKQVTQGVWDQIKNIVSTVLNLIVGVIRLGLNLMKTVINAGWEAIKALTSIAWNAIKAVLSAIWSGIKTSISEDINAIKTIVTAAWNLIKTLTSTAWNAIKTAISTAWSAIQSVVTTAINAVKTVVSTAWGAIKTATSTAWEAIKTTVQNVMDKIPGVITGVAGAAVAAAVALGGKIVSGILSGLGGLVSGLKNKISGAIGDALGSINIPGLSPPEHAAAEAVGKPLAKGMISGFLLGITPLRGKMSESLKTSLEAAKAVIDGYKSKFEQAFGRLASDAISAFDGVTAKHLTKSEKILADMARTEQLKKWSDGLSDANNVIAVSTREITDAADELAQVERKIAKYDPSSTSEKLVDLHQAHRDLNQKITDLTRKRSEEQEKHDAIMLEKKKAALEADAAAERLEYEAKRTRMRTNLSDRLTQLQEQAVKEPGEHRNIQNEVMKVLGSYGITYKKSGLTMGQAFAQGIRDSGKDIESAIKMIATLVARYLKTKSPTEEGPLSTLDKWWVNFGSTLLKGLDEEEIKKRLAGLTGIDSGRIAGGSYAMPNRGRGEGGSGHQTIIYAGSIVPADQILEIVRSGNATLQRWVPDATRIVPTLG